MSNEAKAAFIAESRLRVRYAETDAMGIVHHSNYVIWMEQARTDYCRSAGLSYTEISAQGLELAVTEVAVKYLSPCYFDDELIIKTWVEKVGRVSCRFGYQLYNATTGKISMEGATEHAAVSRDGKVQRFFPRLYQLMLANVGVGLPTTFNRTNNQAKKKNE